MALVMFAVVFSGFVLSVPVIKFFRRFTSI